MRTKFNSLLLSGLLISSSALADGVEFQPMTVDIGRNCSSVILRGTKRFAGTGFVAPKVFLSMNKAGERLFEILPLGGEEFVLRFGLYIPLDIASTIASREGDSQLTLNGCDFNKLRVNLAQRAAKYSGRTESLNADQILRLAALPVRKIKMTIDGISDAFVLGSEQSDIIDYFGLDQVVEFKIPNRKKLAEILARLNGSIGLGVRAEMTFSARSSAEYLDIKIDTKKVSTSVDAAFKGQVKVTHLDLAATIANTLQTMNLDIYQEGDSDAFNQLAQSLIQQFVKAHPEAVVAPTVLANPNPGTRTSNPANPANPGLPILETPPVLPSNGLGSEGTSSGEPGGYDVKTVIKYLSEKKSLTLVYQKMGADEQKSYSTSMIIRADFDDVASRVNRIASSKKKVTIPGVFTKGRNFGMSVEAKSLRKLNFKADRRYFSKEDLERDAHELGANFPELSKLPVSRMKEIETESGLAAQAFSMPGFWDVIWPIYGEYQLLKNTKSIVWGQIKWQESYLPVGDTESIDMTQIDMENLPLNFSFSGVGSRIFGISDLLKENSYFKGTFDSEGGKILIQPKRNLGVIRVINTESFPMKEFYSFQRFQKTSRIFGNQETTWAYANSELKEVPTMQSIYDLRVDFDSDDGKFGAMSFEPAPNASTDRLLVVP